VKREQFRQCVQHGLESLLTLPDELWEWSQPMIRLTMRNGETVVVGIEVMGDGEDSDD
jgi:hypothetical protein